MTINKILLTIIFIVLMVSIASVIALMLAAAFESPPDVMNMAFYTSIISDAILLLLLYVNSFIDHGNTYD